MNKTCTGADDPEERCPRHPSECTCWEVDLNHPTASTLKPEAQAMTDSTIACDHCKKLFDHSLVDAIMLDPDGNNCSTEVYCEPCFEAVKIVPDDKWRPL